MKTKFETGHATNVANFKEMLPFLTGFGRTYNPSQSNLTVVAIQATAAQAESVTAAHTAAVSVLKNAIVARELSFNHLSGLVTRVVNAVRASHPDDSVLDNILHYERKLHGKRVHPKLTDEEKKPLPNKVKQLKKYPHPK